jgi:O-antigen/teichoic acid export membrane protein
MSRSVAGDAGTNLTSHAVSGTAWSGVSTIGRQLLTVASVATVARLLGPRAYGVMGMANLLIAFILYFRDLGTGSAIIQKRTITDSLLSSLFWVSCGFGLLLAVIIALSSSFVAAFFKTPELVPILCVLAVSFWISSCGTTQSALLRREMRFRSLAFVELSSALATYLVALVLAYRGFGVWALVLANVVSSITTVGGYWFASSWRPRREFAADEVSSIAKYSLNLSAFGLVNYFSRNADNLTVGQFLGQSALGDYQMAYNLMLTPIQNISTVIALATFPAFARIQDDDARLRTAYTRSCMLIALITFPVLAGLGVVADPMIRAILGPKWVGAIGVFYILAPLGLFQSVYTTTGQIFQVKGRTDLMFLLGLLSSCILVAAFLIGIHWGIRGVATAYCISYLTIVMPAGYWFAFRLIRLSVVQFAREFVAQLSITAGMATLCLAWLQFLKALNVTNPWTLLISAVTIGVVIYVAAMLALWPTVMQHLDTAITTSGKLPLIRVMSQLRRFRARSTAI